MNGILERNLLALSAADPQLAARVSCSAPSPHVVFTASRTGLPIPIFTEGGIRRFLHSAFDPMKEAARIHQANRGGYLAFLGYGAGYHLLPYIDDENDSRFLVVDRDISLFRAILENTDQRRVLLDRRLRILIDPTPEMLRDHLLSTFLPVLDNGFATVALRPRVESEKEFFASLLPVMHRAVEQLAEDYTVQRSFGKRWMLNTLRNLPAAEASSEVLSPVRSAVVTAAGPSLESGLGEVRAARDAGSLLIATDTSLPTLLADGMEPDVVVSIDCQIYSYHHFLSGIPDRTVLVLDLASPPLLARLIRRTLFFTSGHPFSRLLNARWRAFPFLDTSGGNVTHAAVSLAGNLGARKILLAGADYSYPQGKLYAGDSYLYTFFRTLESRLRPLESSFLSFLFRDGSIRKEGLSGFFRYRSASLDSYRERMEGLIRALPAAVSTTPGEGVPPALPERTVPSLPPESRLFCSGAAVCGFRSFLESYVADLETLKGPGSLRQSFLSRLPPGKRALWHTLLPIAASIRREDELRRISGNGSDALETARIWTIERIRRLLA